MGEQEDVCWGSIVHRIFESTGKSRLSLKKLVKRSAAHAAESLPEKSKKGLKSQARDFISQQSSQGLLQLKHGKVYTGKALAQAPAGPEQKPQSGTDLPGKRKRQQADTPASAQPGGIEQQAKKQKKAKPSKDVTEEPKQTLLSSPAKKQPEKQKTDDKEKPVESTAPAKPRAKKKKKAPASSTQPDLEAGKQPNPKASEEGDKSVSESKENGDATVEDAQDYTWRESRARSDLKHGRFSKQEKDAIQQAAAECAKELNKDATDFGWMFRKGKGGVSKEMGKLWATIAKRACPNRTVRSVYCAGKTLLSPPTALGSWTKEEDETILALVESVGKKWRDISDEIGRTPIAVRDRYRELVTRTEGRNVGHWSEEECARLKEAVAEYLATQQDVEKQQTADLSAEDLVNGGSADSPGPSDGARVVLDDIDWMWVASKVGTRARSQCVTKWYRHLSPSMVTTGQWGVGDDRRLLKNMLASEAAYYSQVPWEHVVPGRTAKQCRRRWALMTKRVPDSAEKSVREQVVYLAKTFAPGLIEKVAALRREQDAAEKQRD